MAGELVLVTGGTGLIGIKVRSPSKLGIQFELQSVPKRKPTPSLPHPPSKH
jgi:hypothetical protein